MKVGKTGNIAVFYSFLNFLNVESRLVYAKFNLV